MSTTTTRGVAHPASAKASPARPRRGCWGSSTFNFWLFTSPFLIGLTVFVYVPIGWSLWLSFFEARFTVTPSKFVGFDNYWQMLQDSKFTGSLVTFTVFAVFIVPATWALSLGLALLVNRLRFMKAFFRSVFFLPTACSYVAAALIWKMSMFSGVRFGLMNTILGWFGVENIAWLANPNPPWYWLADRDAATVAARQFLHDPVPRGAAEHPARAVRGRRHRRRQARLADLPLHHPAAAAGHLDRGDPAAGPWAAPGFRQVFSLDDDLGAGHRSSSCTTPRWARARTTARAVRAR